MSGLTKETPLADSFIELYRKTTTHSADRALIILIDQNKEAIEPLFEARDPLWMHKAFRQTDVCESGNTDLLIWHLIHASQDFFDTLHFFWNKTLDRRDERRKGVLLAECENECEEHARLNGMGSEREAALMARLDECERGHKNVTLKWKACQAEIRMQAEQLAAVTKERDELRQSYQAKILESHNTSNQLTTIQAKYDEVVAVLKRIGDRAMAAPYANSAIIGLVEAALAQLGADRTGEV